MKLSIVLPCLNEESAIGDCLESIAKVIKTHNIETEIIVVDNDSTDNSLKIIESKKHLFPHFTILIERKRGYGSAYMRGLEQARGTYIFMADSDNTYDFAEIPNFLTKLQSGADMVVGNRFSGKIEKNAMPWHHQKIGNPLLSLVVKLFFNVKISDIHCGARAFSKSSYQKLNVRTQGMEFASEMIIKAAKAHLNIVEIPISYKKRVGESKLRSFRDGWRHLRFILIYSPIVIFLIPGFILFIGGLIGTIFNPSLLFSGSAIVGYQLIFFAFFAKIYAITHLNEHDDIFEKLFKFVTIETASIVGLVLITLAIIAYTWIPYAALTTIIIGIETISSAFMLSIISIREG